MNTKKIKIEFLLSRVEDNEFIKEHRRRYFTDGTWDEIKTHERKSNPLPYFYNNFEETIRFDNAF